MVPDNGKKGFEDRLEGKPAIMIRNDGLTETVYSYIPGAMGGADQVAQGLRDIAAKADLKAVHNEIYKDVSQEDSRYLTLAANETTLSNAMHMDNISGNITKHIYQNIAQSESFVQFDSTWQTVFEQHKDNPAELKKDFKLLGQQLDEIGTLPLTFLKKNQDGENVMSKISVKDYMGYYLREHAAASVSDRDLPDYMKAEEKDVPITFDPNAHAGPVTQQEPVSQAGGIQTPATTGSVAVLSSSGDAALAATSIPAESLNVVVQNGGTDASMVNLAQLQQQQVNQSSAAPRMTTSYGMGMS